MGDPKKLKKTYKTPKRPWDSARIELERAMINKYGLKNKREIWKAGALLEKFRVNAKELIPTKREAEKKQLISKLIEKGILKKDSKIEDVLSLQIEDILDRRLQTQIHKLGFVNTAKEARQKVVHGKIRVDGKRVTIPSYNVKTSEEKVITSDAPRVEPVKKIKEGPAVLIEKKPVAAPKKEEKVDEK